MSVFRAALLAAVSTPKQAEADKASLPSQLAACRKAADDLGAAVVAEITIPGQSRDYIFLHDLTAASPEFAQLVELIESEAVNLIACWRFDRLWRNDWIRADLARLCTIHKVQIFSTEQPRAPAPPEQVQRRAGYGQVLEVLSGLASEDEQARRVARHRVGMGGRVAKGLGNATIAPYGYRRETAMRDDKLVAGLVVNETEARWVRTIYERRAEGRSAGAIAAELTRLSVPPPGASRPSHQGLMARHAWSHVTIQRILRNPTYIGIVRWGDFVNESGAHPALIERDLWERVQALIAAGPGHGPAVSECVRTGAWLRGLLRCGYCGYSMIYTVKHGYLNTCCALYTRSQGAQCQNNGHGATRLHAWVQDRILAMLADPAAWAEARAAQRDASADEIHLADLTAAIAANRERLTRVQVGYEAGAYTITELVAARVRLDAEHAELQTQARALQSHALDDDAARVAFASITQMAGAFVDAPAETKNRWAAAIIRRITLIRESDPVIEWW